MYHLPLPALQTWLRPVVDSSAVMRELQSGSAKLAGVRSETERLALKTGCGALVAHVLFGSEDHIVSRDRYLYDKTEPPVEGRSHKDICKPGLLRAVAPRFSVFIGVYRCPSVVPKASWAASPVLRISTSVCAADTNAASNCDGGR